jgi:hypothetical protein
MNVRSSGIDHDEWYDWTRSTYKLRVRAGKTVFLWGSAGVANQSFKAPLTLHVRNDMFGVQIKLGSQKAGGGQTPIGTLQPGECLSLPINHICGVYATCANDSIVSCRIEG